MAPKRLLRDRELSAATGIPLPTIRNDRLTHQRLPFIRIGRACWYDPQAVEAAFNKMSRGGKP